MSLAFFDWLTLAGLLLVGLFHVQNWYRLRQLRARVPPLSGPAARRIALRRKTKALISQDRSLTGR